MRRLAEIQIRDPFLVCEDQVYYLFGSTDKDIWHGPGVGFDVYRGSRPGEFTSFEGPFPAFRPPAGFWSTTNFWAPEVHAHHGAFFMFASFQPVHGRRGTAVLRSERVMGPYVPWSEGPVTPPEWECLDGTFFVDVDARPWMVFCHEWTQVGDGQVCAMPMDATLRRACGAPRVLFTASQAPWAAPLRDRAPGSYVTDGPYVVRHPSGALLILWSSFGVDGKYCIGVARSRSGVLDGPWTQSDQPLYEADGGHGMVFAGPDSRLFLAIHTPNSTPDERPVFIGLRTTEDGLAVTGEIFA
ncbi:MAG: glycoside hydrolase family 43 protein [Propionibacteriaceae bacterium]|nr:glycoside hydrolase family 43 protein [Propionibacteriaceae bacterium]